MQMLAAAGDMGALPVEPRLWLCSSLSLFLSFKKRKIPNKKSIKLFCGTLKGSLVLGHFTCGTDSAEKQTDWTARPCVVDFKLVWMNISGAGAELLH